MDGSRREMTLQQASAEMRLIDEQLAKQYPRTTRTVALR
jgi:hypothetical protein